MDSDHRQVRQLRVLAVSPKGVLGGAEKWLLTVLTATDRAEVCLAVLEDGPLVGRARQSGWRVHVRAVGRGPAHMAAANWWLLRVARREMPDVILANSAKAGAAALLLSRMLGVPMVLVKHGFGFERTLLPLLAREVAALIAVSPEQAEGLPPDKTTVIYPPTPPPPAPLTADDERPPRLVMLTRLVENKGVDIAIRAVSAEPAWQLHVAGVDDPAAPGERDRLVELARSLGSADRIVVGPPVADPYEALADAVAAASLIRHSDGPWPSKEGFGLVVVEAARMGIPSLADPDRVASVHALGGAGVVPVRSDDVESVRDALRALADPLERRAIGEAGRAAAQALPTVEQAADHVCELLARAAHRPGAGRSGGPPFTVAAPVLNEIGAVDELVASLVGQLQPAPGGLDQGDEAMIVDGGSVDGTYERLLAHASREPRLRVLRCAGGVSRQRNLAVAEAANDWIAFTDAGCRPDADWLDAFRRAAAADVDLLTGFYRVAFDGRPWQRAMLYAGYPDLAEARRADLHVRTYTRFLGLTHRAELPNGRSLAFSRAGWRRGGGFPDGVAVAEDVLFGRGIVEAGGTALLQTEACVLWEQRPSLGATCSMYIRYGRGDARTGRPLLIARNLLRASVYLAVPVMVSRGGEARWAAFLGMGLYASLPLRRAMRDRAGIRVIALTPAMMALRDIAKASGAIAGLVADRRKSAR